MHSSLSSAHYFNFKYSQIQFNRILDECIVLFFSPSIPSNIYHKLSDGRGKRRFFLMTDWTYKTPSTLCSVTSDWQSHGDCIQVHSEVGCDATVNKMSQSTLNIYTPL